MWNTGSAGPPPLPPTPVYVLPAWRWCNGNCAPDTWSSLDISEDLLYVQHNFPFCAQPLLEALDLLTPSQLLQDTLALTRLSAHLGLHPAPAPSSVETQELSRGLGRVGGEPSAGTLTSDSVPPLSSLNSDHSTMLTVRVPSSSSRTRLWKELKEGGGGLGTRRPSTTQPPLTSHTLSFSFLIHSTTHAHLHRLVPYFLRSRPEFWTWTDLESSWPPPTYVLPIILLHKEVVLIVSSLLLLTLYLSSCGKRVKS